MFNLAKNFMTGKAAQIYLNGLIGRYGELSDLKIDPQAKTVDVVLKLRGESEPLTVRIDQYVIKEKDGRSFAHVAKCTCSRPWVQALADDFVIGREVEVPPWALAAV